ncbi:Bardet-Biedl syndrome 2 protein [Pleodorina starrii]|uniref:Bardet-Biedl syndrome 2 protein n=1 Tax=Pleodorina starrii TaxID=330485 RepID=A0A9W6BC93_9CHLO|nr:Bardet-Biedl syndrome 2 protein [Pleodorina starrii]GLC49509.1 Bardet-Biedl syndrome 2 protein [Pleodorina starrii]GLC70011.1 Bardet-Biedl syndrome 2 protein [Pleodorina starrii]
MLVPAFQLHLSEKIQRAQAAIGRFDGKVPALACATVGGKVFLHQPHQQGGGSDNQITYLNINKQISAVVAGRLTGSKDVLLVGTPSNLQCYDVDLNRDLFYKDVQDGVNVCLVGPFGSGDSPLALVGGNCSIQGFSADGHEKFWTVTGDNVSAMAFCDVDQDGRNELLVGSDDFDVRIFCGEDVIAEVPEADQFVALTAVLGPQFGYALVNGTIGLYNRLDRVWRVKSKHSVCAIASYDLDADGLPELISGWGNGRMEVRRADSGEVVYRDHLSCPVAAILRADYRNDKTMDQVVVCGVEGEVRGYLPLDLDVAPGVAAEVDFSDQQAAVAELAQRKQELMYEMASYSNMRQTKDAAPERSSLIPSDTRVDSYIAINKETASCDLVLRTSNDSAVIRGVVVFGEQIFEEESLFVYPKKPDTTLAVPLKPLKDVSVVLMIKVLVGGRTASLFHVFELEIELPKFALYAAVERGAFPEPASSVTFSVSERIPRLCAWVESRFTLKATSAGRNDTLEAYFLCLRDRTPLGIKAVPVGGSVQITVRTDNMDMAGELVGDLAAYLGLSDLGSTVDFPAAMKAFKEVLNAVDEHNITRLRMNADMADSSNLIKQLIIKAEDARILGDVRAMRKYYRQLADMNRDLIAEHGKRSTNHLALLETLREVNQMIQRAARLRVGASKAKVVTTCRAAIKNNNMAALFKIIRDGDGPV